MRTAMLGSLEVSVMGLGCNNFGRALDARRSADVVRAALDAGINHFDTASNYGEGQSEEFLGAALGQHREEVVISTKFGVPVAGWDGSGGARPDYIREVFQRSLDQLGTDYVDLYMLHKPDLETPIEDTLEVMHQLVEEGKVREIGCSNLDAGQLEKALGISTDRSWSSFISNQVEYSLVHREPESDGLSAVCRDRGVSLLPYYPLASGLLTGKTRRGDQPQGRLRMDRYQGYLTEANFDLVERLDQYASDRAVTMVQVALGWLLAQDVVPTVAAGATSPEQVASNALAAEWEPTADDLEALAILLEV